MSITQQIVHFLKMFLFLFFCHNFLHMLKYVYHIHSSSPSIPYIHFKKLDEPLVIENTHTILALSAFSKCGGLFSFFMYVKINRQIGSIKIERKIVPPSNKMRLSPSLTTEPQGKTFCRYRN